jgi:F420-non-reducing hydrogenase iron-sulfur subunit
MSDESRWKPKIVGFLCNWCSYAGADLAGTSRKKYSPSVRIVRVMCSGRVEPSLILKAFERRADGVLVCG